MMHQAALTRTKFHFLESFSSPCSLLLTSDDGEFIAAGCSGCLPNKKAASNQLWKCLKVVFYQVCMSADKRSCRNVSFFNGAWRDILSTEGKMARITSNVICVTLLCLSPCLCMWAKSTQRRGKVTQPLPLAQPASALKLRQAVIINEETWANGQEMQRYWLGRLPCSKPCRLAPAWWPVVSQAAVCRGGGQPRCETRPPLAAVCHVQATPEGQSTGDRMRRKKKRRRLTWAGCANCLSSDFQGQLWLGKQFIYTTD